MKYVATLLSAATLAALPLVATQTVRAQDEPRPNQFWWPNQDFVAAWAKVMTLDRFDLSRSGSGTKGGTQ